jgi:hypothetical protein
MAVAAAGQVFRDLVGEYLDRVRVGHRVVVDGQAATDPVSRQTRPARLEAADHDVAAMLESLNVAEHRGLDRREIPLLGGLQLSPPPPPVSLRLRPTALLCMITPSGEFSTMLPDTTAWLLR